ncbi:hypothetical protein JIR001_15060 [Polycladomyces abyssicola]|uniref:Uncharacterized protein n=1 Tax=Polycladomyces abyssicola TaxID=1125966 RepID=A0A8D5ZNV5_9BACL|nr:hypothetical protein JIR001_15060 [Polycladomyces abyssicola]
MCHQKDQKKTPLRLDQTDPIETAETVHVQFFPAEKDSFVSEYCLLLFLLILRDLIVYDVHPGPRFPQSEIHKFPLI